MTAARCQFQAARSPRWRAESRRQRRREDRAANRDRQRHPVTGTWTTSDTTVGSVGADGVFHANGLVGGTVEVTILVGRGQITTTITVDVDIIDNPTMVPAAAQTSSSRRPG